jgi:hypothetical protein
VGIKAHQAQLATSAAAVQEGGWVAAKKEPIEFFAAENATSGLEPVHLYTCPGQTLAHIDPVFYRGLSEAPRSEARGGNYTLILLVHDIPVFYTPTKADKTAAIVYEYHDQPSTRS